ncbi:MAG: HAMP domain-containing histidine kinase [Anaerolineae bacterium]|nr:HAMP domain-containing histidine kinase [Anaerolineae bacterium]
MYSIDAGSSSLLDLVLVALAVLVIGGQLYMLLSTASKLGVLQREYSAMQAELHEQTMALEQLQEEASRLKEGPKAELLSMLQLAHELRSPLASIQSVLDIVLQGYTKNNAELQDEMLDMARDRAVMMLGQVNDFLGLGAIRHSEIERKVQPVQLLDVLERLIREKRVRAKWRSVDLDLKVPDSLATVNATPEDMEHLLSNLINNAIKYTEPGGKVTVCLKEENGDVVGIVEDTGIGIVPEDIPRIFDEFYRAEAARSMDVHGTGLGLSIAKRVVDLHGGQIHVESKVGEGSTFTFVFPKAEAERGPSLI